MRLSKGSKDNYICQQLLKQKMNTINQPNMTETDTDNDMDIDMNNIEHKDKEKEIEECTLTQVRLLPLSTEIKQSLYQQYKLIGEKPILLIKLPKTKELTINSIIDKFIKYQTAKIEAENALNPNEEKIYLKQVMESIGYYFNQFIDINLLYKNELNQKKLLMEKYGKQNDIDYCDLYGIEHLFRLLYILPRIYANIKQLKHMQIAKISNYVSLLNGFLTQRIKEFHVEFNINKNKKNHGLVMN